ncbi:hypothetical protein [Flavobacterium gelatinilyticum]|uniref:hypothetical protein n=1 Tax=Flavobacterium gelatinilyticum TaxID=3003260 RepID=UPI002481494F|nr:hypothetical protein [Flavobacterium gelatinilyticum]
MKTYTTHRQNSSHFYLIGLLSFLLASCGSYQNTSYHDNDGVYGSSTNRYAQTNNNNVNNQYKDYFRSLQDDNQPTEIFTDVDSYGSYSANDSTQTASVAYPAWGSANSEVSINVYSDPTWSMGFGWGYPYYGWGYGGGYWGNYWGAGYWGGGYWGGGWGYPGYYGPGWGYPGYWGPRYYANYSYNYGRRGSAAYYGGRNYASNRSYAANRSFTNRSYSSDRTYSTNRSGYTTNRNYTTNRSNSYSDYRRGSSVNGRSYNNGSTSSPTFSNRRSYTPSNNSSYDYSNRRSSSSAPSNRSYNNSSSAPTRSYSPSPSRSSNSSGSMRSSGGGGGGGRSYGGGGGGRR